MASLKDFWEAVKRFAVGADSNPDKKHYEYFTSGEYHPDTQDAIDEATRSGRLRGSHLEGEIPMEKSGIFSGGGSSGGSYSSKEFSKLVKQRNRLADRIADLKGRNRPVEDLEKQLAELDKKLPDLGDKFWKGATSAKDARLKAIEALKTERDEVIDASHDLAGERKGKLDERLDTLRETHQELEQKAVKLEREAKVQARAAKIDGTKFDAALETERVAKEARNASNAAKEHVTAHEKRIRTLDKLKGKKAGDIEKQYNDKIKDHQKVIDHIEDLEKDYEKTGRKVADHLTGKPLEKAAVAGSVEAAAKAKAETGFIGKEAWAQKSMLTKPFAAAEALWKSGGIGKARVTAGVVLVPTLGFLGAKDIAEGVGIKDAGVDEQGNPLPTEGKLFSGIAKVGGAVLAGLLATMGGGKLARGV